MFLSQPELLSSSHTLPLAEPLQPLTVPGRRLHDAELNESDECHNQIVSCKMDIILFGEHKYG